MGIFADGAGRLLYDPEANALRGCCCGEEGSSSRSPSASPSPSRSPSASPSVSPSRSPSASHSHSPSPSRSPSASPSSSPSASPSRSPSTSPSPSHSQAGTRWELTEVVFSRTSSWCNAELSLGPAVGDVYEAALVRTAADAALQEVVVSVTGSVQSWQTCTCAGDLLYPADFTFDTSGVSGGIWTVEYWCDACPGLSSRRESHRLKLKFRQL